MIQTKKQLSADEAIVLAVKALQEASAIVPASANEEEIPDDAEDDSQATAPAFIKKLKDLVDDPEIDSAVWSEDNASFVIHEPTRLSEQLVKYFKSSKLKSFVRQLHFYGFKKIGGSRYVDWVYSHKFFQKDGRLLHKLRRKTCGPDQQIKNLQSRVDNLQGSLVQTQKKLGDMAVALMALMQHHHSASLLGNNSNSKNNAPHGTSIDSMPVKRQRRSNGATSNPSTTIARFEKQPFVGSGGGGGGGAAVKTEAQEARRLPATIGYNELLSNNINVNISVMGSSTGMTPTDFDFGFEFDDLFTPMAQEELGLLPDVETRVGGGAVGVTA